MGVAGSHQEIVPRSRPQFWFLPHLSFGMGQHFCVGAVLARAEANTATNHLLDAMPDFRLKAGVRPQESGVFARGLATLPLVFFTPARTV